MPDLLTPVTLTVDLGRNTIEIVTAAAEPGSTGAGVIERHPLEMGVRGRLLGIELDDDYLMICPPAADDAALARTVAAEMTVVRDAVGEINRVSLPRRGAGYEITFPSGNQ